MTVSKTPAGSEVLPSAMAAHTLSTPHNNAAHFLIQNRPTPTASNVVSNTMERAITDAFQNRGGRTIGFHKRKSTTAHTPITRKMIVPKPAL